MSGSSRHSFSSENMEEIKRVFKRFDSDGDGKISSSELNDVLRVLGSDTSPQELKQMMDEIDTDGDGFIDLKEFAEFHCSGSNGDEGFSNGYKELREAFEMYDKDKNGLITATELHMVLQSLGEKCSLSDCSWMIRSVDSDGDGSVNFEEFKQMMSNGNGRANGEIAGPSVKD